MRAFCAKRTREKRGYCSVRRKGFAQDSVYLLRDGQGYTVPFREGARDSRSGYAFRHFAQGCNHTTWFLAAPDALAHCIVARLRARAGEHDVAQTREPCERLGPRPERNSQARDLREPARDEGCACALSKSKSFRDSRRDGQHILERGANLDANEIVGGVEPQLRC